MSTKQASNPLTSVQTDDYILVNIKTGIPSFVDDCIRAANGDNTRFLDGGTAPSFNCPDGTIIHSNRAGVDKHSDYPVAFGLVWLLKTEVGHASTC